MVCLGIVTVIIIIIGKVILNNVYEESNNWRSTTVKNITLNDEEIIQKVNDYVNKDGKAEEVLAKSFEIREVNSGVKLGEFDKNKNKFVLYLTGNRKEFSYKIEEVCTCRKEGCSLYSLEKRIYLVYI